MLNDTDRQILNERGISEQTVAEQLWRFETGFPFLHLAGSATVGNGIKKLTPECEQACLDRWQRYLADGGSVAKFVPASGAASRMFKSLLAFVNGEETAPAPGSDVETLLANTDRLPFIDQLNETLRRTAGADVDALKAQGRFKDIVKAIVDGDGMNYASLPKGLLAFHRYADNSVRTPLEEHMVEGAQTAAAAGTVKLHFTVSGAHRQLFHDKIEAVRNDLERKTSVKYDISLSEQKASTDTIAVNPDNTVFRDKNGNPVFRPGGHGALIENLADMDSAVVFIKNIDNVVPDSRRADTIHYKKVLAGALILAHDTVARYISLLDTPQPPRRDELLEMARFAADTLCTTREGVTEMTDADLARYLRRIFDRPLRVCGMVVNEGEPGGGPYLVRGDDGTVSPQILESTQIDTADPEAMAMMSRATHFNPVDLVCYIRDTNGQPFDLKKFVDPATGFISSKSAEGRDLKALELPGLWNGAMSDWSTIFVEVPQTTFNPVKTVNDLLRGVHQAR